MAKNLAKSDLPFKRSVKNPYWKTFDFEKIPPSHADILRLTLLGITKEKVADKVGCTPRQVYKVTSHYGLKSAHKGKPIGAYGKKRQTNSLTW